MARVSIEDCLHSIENRFALAMVAADRARSLMTGEVPLLKTRNKEVVTALREITDGMIFSNVAIPEREGQLGVMPKNYGQEEILDDKEASISGAEASEPIAADADVVLMPTEEAPIVTPEHPSQDTINIDRPEE